MAAGVPVILSVEGEAAGIIRDSDAGIVVEPENPQQMAEAIEALRTDPVRRKRLGQNGLRTATRNYDRQILNGAYISALVSVAQSPAREQ
jgi:glycosyltransferase involved in cell wall biosynthesis